MFITEINRTCLKLNYALNLKRHLYLVDITTRSKVELFFMCVRKNSGNVARAKLGYKSNHSFIFQLFTRSHGRVR